MDFKKIETKWQNKWEKAKIFKSKEGKKKKFYMLEMYPYPSSHGLHMGHARNYTIGDVYTRFKRMNGFNVLYPMGYDSFGLPAENAAIKANSHPKIFTEAAIKNFIKQQKSLGLSYDWSRLLMSHDPNYYKWDQWIFLQLLKKDLAYKKKSAVNWCPKCNTVLANEQVSQGKCWRHEDTDVEIKELEQWFFKITDYTEKLLKDIDKLDWPEDIKIMQRNWIGKSEGLLFTQKVKDMNIEFQTYNSVPQMAYADTFYIIAPEHPLVYKLVKGTKYEKVVMEFVEYIKKKKILQKFDVENDIEGIFTGRYVRDPLGNGDLPIWIASYAIAEYGTGIVKCSAHDERDFRFAKKYKIPLKVVLVPKDSERRKRVEKFEEFYREDDGILIEPKEMLGKTYTESRELMIDYLVKRKLAKRVIQYKLRDWLISRQRYWGCPIPIVYCDKCGIVPVPEKDLPVKLLEKVSFKVEGNPLASCKDFVNAKCPKCKSKARRETDTMDTFIDSSWYFLRYCDPKNSKKIFDSKKVNYWMPIDQYIGGKEHACGHLIYFRFITKFLHDLGLIKIEEPAKKLFNQGMLHLGGFVMSKSRGNVVTPEEISKKYGIDTARLFLTFVAAPDKDMEWSDKGIQGMLRFVNKLISLADKKFTKESKLLTSKLHRTIKEVTEDIENFQYNLAVIKLMEFTDYLHNEEISKNAYEILLKLLSPFAPHICEELWNKLSHKKLISLEKWPSYDTKKINEKVEKEYELIQKTILDIRNILKLIKIKPKTVYIYTIPNELKLFEDSKDKIKKNINLELEIYAVNNLGKYDPQGKAKKAKPGKPAIYIE